MEQDTRMKVLKATGLAIAAAALYAISTPFSKILLEGVSPTMMASLLYLGAGIGLLLVSCSRRIVGRESGEAPLDRSDLPYTVAMVVLDIAAPILLMTGLTMTSSATTSLLNNFEIVATTVIALVIFRENVSKTLWTAIYYCPWMTSLDSSCHPVHSSCSVPASAGVWRTTAPGGSPRRIPYR